MISKEAREAREAGGRWHSNYDYEVAADANLVVDPLRDTNTALLGPIPPSIAAAYSPTSVVKTTLRDSS